MDPSSNEPRLARASLHPSQFGLDRLGERLKSIEQASAQISRSTVCQRLQDRPDRPRPFGWNHLAINVGRAHADWRTNQHKMILSFSGTASTRSPRPRQTAAGACAEEGHVAADLARQGVELLPAASGDPRAGPGHERRRGVARAAGQPRLRRDRLVKHDPRPSKAARRRPQALGRLHHQIVTANRQGRLVTPQADLARRVVGEGQGIVQAHGDHQRLDLVIAVGPTPQDLQEQV